MSHYFKNDSSLADDIKKFDYNYKGLKFNFLSNSGLFSTGNVDFATDLMLNAMPPIEGKLLDMGCGYGVVGIVLGRVYKVDVTMADVNEKAIEFSTKNCEENKVNAKIILSNCFEKIDEKFNAIAINPPIHAGKSVVYEMYEKSFEHLENGGKLFVVINKKHGAESTIKKLQTLFGEVKTIEKKKGFFVLESVK